MYRPSYQIITQALWIARPSRDINPYSITAQGKNITDIYTYGKNNAWDNTCKVFADMLSDIDKNFNRNQFLQACGVEEYQDLCPKYNEPVLPNENGKCSLCELHEVK